MNNNWWQKDALIKVGNYVSTPECPRTSCRVTRVTETSVTVRCGRTFFIKDVVLKRR